MYNTQVYLNIIILILKRNIVINIFINDDGNILILYVRLIKLPLEHC